MRTTARLHLGFLDLNGSRGRLFGSLGIALDGPETHIHIARCPHAIVTGPDRERAVRYMNALEHALDLEQSHRVEILAAIPAHSGLGSGTQLALALAAGVRALHGREADAEGDSVLLERGARSGIGIALFRFGGLVLDGGRGQGTRVPPMLARLCVPESWRVLLLRDPSAQGLSGASEREAFAALPPMAEDVADRVCRLAVMQALPAAAEADLGRFGAAITEIQRLVGAYFAPAQGGSACTSPSVAAGLERLAAAGATGLGQTSWGPTGFAFVDSDGQARRLADMLRGQSDTERLDISIHSPRNRGAAIGPVPYSKGEQGL